MQRTRKANGAVRCDITKALLELMAEKPLDSISVTELTARAQVARVSFYRNFSSKDDVLRRHAQHVTEEWQARMVPHLREREPRAFMRALLEHMLDEREATELLMRSGRMDIMRAEFDRALDVGCEDRSESARRAYLSGGLYNLTYQWVLAGYEPGAETLADFVYELVC